MQRYRLITDLVKENAISQIRELPIKQGSPFIVEIKEESRTVMQNAKLHALLRDIAKQLKYDGRKLSIHQWKNLLVSGHAVATNEDTEIIQGIEGELVSIREETSRMSVKRFNSLIEYVYAWATENGVIFSE